MTKPPRSENFSLFHDNLDDYTKEIIIEKFYEKGIEKVYHNGINGINAMPPKGGTDLSDEKMKEVIDYMINSSK